MVNVSELGEVLAARVRALLEKRFPLGIYTARDVEAAMSSVLSAVDSDLSEHIEVERDPDDPCRVLVTVMLDDVSRLKVVLNGGGDE